MSSHYQTVQKDRDSMRPQYQSDGDGGGAPGCCASRGCAIALLVIGAVLLAAGIFALVGLSGVIDTIIDDNVPMTSDDSILFKIWADGRANEGIALRRYFFMWNLTNPFEVYNYHDVPDFHKIGPFVFDEHLYSTDIRRSADNTNISFRYFVDFTFNAELSVDPELGPLNESMVFTTVNLPLSAVAHRLSRFPSQGNATLEESIAAACYALIPLYVNSQVVGPHGIFINRTVREFMFGFVDDLWLALKDTTASIDYSVPSEFRALFNHSQPAPSPYTFRSGQRCPMWDNQSECNSSGTRDSVIYTGKGDIALTGQTAVWAGNDAFGWWSAASGGENGGGPVDAPCEAPRGSNGANFPPHLTRDSEPYVFVDQIFRSVQLSYQEDVSFASIPGLRFGIAPSEVQFSGRSACYDQSYVGVFNLTRAVFGPMFITQPYFFAVPLNQTNLENDRGLALVNITVDGTPLAALHASGAVNAANAGLIVDIEPRTGALMRAHGRIQLATWLKDFTIAQCPDVFPQLGVKNISVPVFNATTNTTTYVWRNNSHFPSTLVPVLHLDRQVELPSALAAKIYRSVVLPFIIIKYGGPALCAFAALLILLGVGVARRYRAVAGFRQYESLGSGITREYTATL